MSLEENLPDLSTDLIIQIFSRLPSKSIARFRCVSKLWASLLTPGSPYFTELFLTQSVTQSRLLFTVQRDNYKSCLYSCPQPQISYKNSTSSLSVTAEFHMSLPKTWILNMSPPISGLMYFSNMQNLNEPRLCNPSTGYVFRLPNLIRAKHSYFGYDPINKQFSILAISRKGPYDPTLPSNYQILKLGSGRLSWRNLDCPLHHHPLQTNICINGILYYIAKFKSKPYSKIVGFDLNSEEFKFIDNPPWFYDSDLLINFKGKLGQINSKSIRFGFFLCILEDVKKQKWSRHVYFLPSRLRNTKHEPNCIIGVTTMGEVVLSLDYITHPFYVYFFNLEKNILQQVKIKGLEDFKFNCFYGCVDYVEELRVLNCS